MSTSSQLPARVRYGDEVVGSLRARAKQRAAAPDLREELALAREMLDDAIEAYDAAVHKAIHENLDVHRVRIAAGALVGMAIDRVEKVAYTHSRISSSKFLAMPDVSALIEQFVGTVDTALAEKAGNLRMAGLDPAVFMHDLAGKLRELESASLGAAMATFGPAGPQSIEEARDAANSEAAMMDNTVPECIVQAHEENEDAA